MKRIMYIENKSGDLDGPGRIGWVENSRTARVGRNNHRALRRMDEV